MNSEVFEAPSTETAAVLPVPHRATCRQCPASLLFHGTASGNGIVVLEQSGMELDTPIGIGDAGLPVCPSGHGEMELADESLPAAEAIAQVAEQLQTGDFAPLQGTLPGVFPDFNYQAAYLELEGKAQEVDNLKHEWEADKEAAAASKKAWEKAADLYTKMALEFQRRRREKVDAGSPNEVLDPDRCRWEQANPDKPCPICRESEPGSVLPSPDSALHVDEVVKLLDQRDAVQTLEALEAIGIVVTEAAVRAWSPAQRDEVRVWAILTLENADPLPARPACLGTTHIAGPIYDSGQACTQCDAVLIAAGDEVTYYTAGTLVGIDCPGKPVDAHRYIKRGGKKRKSRDATAAVD